MSKNVTYKCHIQTPLIQLVKPNDLINWVDKILIPPFLMIVSVIEFHFVKSLLSGKGK